jgi:hypothetical protein
LQEVFFPQRLFFAIAKKSVGYKTFAPQGIERILLET